MIDIRRFDTGLLITFCTLYELNSVSLTAHKMCLTQSTVSAALARLRDIFEDELFVRTQKGILPTKKAEALAPKIKKIVSEIQELAEPEIFDPKIVEDTLAFSVNDYMQSSLMMPLIKVIREQAPLLKIVIRPMVIKDLNTLLGKGEIDFALSIPEFMPPGLLSMHLYREKYICAIRKKHPLKKNKISAKEFCNFDHILVSPEDGGFTGATDTVLKKMGMKRNVAISVSNFLILEELLQQDNFISMIPEKLFLANSSRLRRVDIPFEVPGFDVISLWHKRTDQSPLHMWVRSLLSDIV